LRCFHNQPSRHGTSSSCPAALYDCGANTRSTYISESPRILRLPLNRIKGDSVGCSVEDTLSCVEPLEKPPDDDRANPHGIQGTNTGVTFPTFTTVCLFSPLVTPRSEPSMYLASCSSYRDVSPTHDGNYDTAEGLIPSLYQSLSVNENGPSAHRATPWAYFTWES